MGVYHGHQMGQDQSPEAGLLDEGNATGAARRDARRRGRPGVPSIWNLRSVKDQVVVS